MLAFDLDHFKSINDKYGHETGDGVLRLFADIASEVAGPAALSARLGGEEFAILLPKTGAESESRVAERIARRFSDEVARNDGFRIAATVSVGLAQSEADDADLNGLLVAADRALYRAKELGRDRIEIAKPAPDRPVRRIALRAVGA